MQWSFFLLLVTIYPCAHSYPSPAYVAIAPGPNPNPGTPESDSSDITEPPTKKQKVKHVKGDAALDSSSWPKITSNILDIPPVDPPDTSNNLPPQTKKLAPPAILGPSVINGLWPTKNQMRAFKCEYKIIQRYLNFRFQAVSKVWYDGTELKERISEKFQMSREYEGPFLVEPEPTKIAARGKIKSRPPGSWVVYGRIKLPASTTSQLERTQAEVGKLQEVIGSIKRGNGPDVKCAPIQEDFSIWKPKIDPVDNDKALEISCKAKPTNNPKSSQMISISGPIPEPPAWIGPAAARLITFLDECAADRSTTFKIEKKNKQWTLKTITRGYPMYKKAPGDRNPMTGLECVQWGIKEAAKKDEKAGIDHDVIPPVCVGPGAKPDDSPPISPASDGGSAQTED